MFFILRNHPRYILCLYVRHNTNNSDMKRIPCFTVKRNRSDALPASPAAAQAIAIDCGIIILLLVYLNKRLIKKAPHFLPI